jgi:hypothetical protein
MLLCGTVTIDNNDVLYIQKARRKDFESFPHKRYMFEDDGVNSVMIYCKNICKCQNEPSVQQ